MNRITYFMLGVFAAGVALGAVVLAPSRSAREHAATAAGLGVVAVLLLGRAAGKDPWR